MTSMFSYLITIAGVVFWIIRLVITFTSSLNIDIGIEPIDFNIEVVLLFVTLFCMILIVKRNIIGALIYFVAYGGYFGTDLYNGIINIKNGDTNLVDYVTLFVSFLGVLIAFLTLLDIFLNKERKGSTRDGKTDWFYKNKEYTRKLDERADTNQYRIK